MRHENAFRTQLESWFLGGFTKNFELLSGGAIYLSAGETTIGPMLFDLTPRRVPGVERLPFQVILRRIKTQVRNVAWKGLSAKRRIENVGLFPAKRRVAVVLLAGRKCGTVCGG
jgi:hypothetical protein